MTNEPPNGDGEELVEADLPGMDGPPRSSDGAPQAPGPDPEVPETSEGSAGDQLAETLSEITESPGVASDIIADSFGFPRASDAPRESDETFDNNPSDPVFDDLKTNLPLHVTGDPSGQAEYQPSGEPFQPDPTNDGEEELVEADLPGLEGGDDLVEADLPTTSTGEFSQPAADPEPATEPERSFDEIVDDRIRQIGENLEADELAREAERRERTLEAMRREYGDDVDVESLYRHDELQRTRESFFERITPETSLGKFLTLVLAGAGVTVAVFMAFAIFGGESDEPEPQVEVPANAAIEVSTAAPTVAATIPPQPEDVRLEQLALGAVAASADADGDLWLTLALEDGVSVDPDTLSFLYAFAFGAAVQADNGYNGVYYSVAGGQSYAEAVFGSTDFPRISNAFNATFQVDQASLWITDDGRLAIELPGDTPGSGLDASLFGPDTPVIAGVSFLEEEGGTAEGGFEEFTLGEVTVALDWPSSDWTEIEPDSEPLRLNVPDTSDRN